MAVVTEINSIVCLILACKLLVSDAQEPCVNATAWVGVPEDEYDMSYSSIKDPAGRPYGFSRSTIPYDPTSSSRPYPCISISRDIDGNSLTGKRIEVMAESNPPGSVVCFSRGQEETCGDSGIYVCEQTTADTVSYVFYCSGQSCSDQDVPFFYRFAVNPPKYGDPEVWCMERNTDQYPSTLAPLPPGLTLPPPPQTTPAGAPSVAYHSTVLMALGGILALFAHL